MNDGHMQDRHIDGWIVQQNITEHLTFSWWVANLEIILKKLFFLFRQVLMKTPLLNTCLSHFNYLVRSVGRTPSHFIVGTARWEVSNDKDWNHKISGKLTAQNNGICCLNLMICSYFYAPTPQPLSKNGENGRQFEGHSFKI